MKNTNTTIFRLWQKIIAMVCMVVLLIPLIVDYRRTAAATAETENKLVVLLVNNTLFEGDPDDKSLLTGKIYRYAEDLQAALPRTRTLVLPVSSAESPGDIFAVLEKLYLEGHERGQGKFRLSGVVLIGDVPLPIVRTAQNDAVSVFPYTDFESPAFIWQDNTDIFVPNTGSSQMQAEVFHGVIRAPGDASKTENEWLSQYFDKNHAYHTGETAAPDQTLFFADLIGEYTGLHPLMLWMYEAAEGIFASDIAHYRYNFPLYEDVRALFAAGVNADIDLSAFPNAQKQMQGEEETSDDFPYPDSLTHQYIRQYLPHFVKVASSFFSIADPLVKGSGRWMITEGNVGTLPTYISGMDIMSKEFLREMEAEAEQLLFDHIDTNIQRPVEMLTSVVQDWSYTKNGDRRERLDTYDNQLNGRKLKYVHEAEQCSIIRGEKPESPREIGDNRQLVELTHLLNRFDKRMLSGDKDACDPYGGCCFLNSFTPEKCVNNAADEPIWDPIGGQLETQWSQKNFLECTRISKPKIWIATEDYKVVDDMPRTKLQFTTAEIPSTILHNEPRPETIAAAIKKTISGAIPADENHAISYRGPGGNGIKIYLPDLIENEFLAENGSTTEAKFHTAYADVEKQIRIQNLRSNLISYVGFLKSQPREYHLAPTKTNINPPIPSVAPTPIPVEGEEPAPTPIATPLTPVPIREGYVTEKWNVEPYQGMPYLEYQIDQVWTEAEKLLQSRFSNTGDRNDLWIEYIDNAPADLRQQIESMFQNIVDPLDYQNLDLDIDQNDILSYQEFVAQEGASLTTWTAPPSPQCVNNPLSPYCLEYFPMPNLQRWYPQQITFAVAPDPGVGFLTPYFDQLVTKFGTEPLEEFGKWRSYNSDQKHVRALELFFGNNTPEYLKGNSNGFEFSSMRALGNADEIWWGGKDRVYIKGDDADWDGLYPAEVVLEEEPEIPIDGEGTAPLEEEPPTEENQCSEDAYMKGVPITEWLPAMQCWLDDTMSKPLSIEMSSQCSYTGVLGESDYDIYSDAWSAGAPQVPNGARIVISGTSGNYLLEGDTSSVTIRFENPDGSLVTGGVAFTARPIGDLQISVNSPFSNSSTEYSDTTFSGEFVLPVTMTGDGKAGIRVSAEKFGDAEMMFSAIGDGKLLLEKTGSDDATVQNFRVSVLNQNGIKLSGYTASALASVSDPTNAELVSEDVPLTNGSGTVTVRMIGNASSVLTVTLNGFAPAHFLLAGVEKNTENEVGEAQLALLSPPQVLYANEEVVLEVTGISAAGVKSTSPKNVSLKPTTETAEGVSVRALGDNRFGVTSPNRTDTIRLLVEAPGYRAFRTSFPVVFRVTTAEMRRVNPNTLAMSLLGSNFADFSKSADPIANAILFGDVPQAVLSSINPMNIAAPRLSVFNNGALRLFERGLEANIAAYSPLTVRIFDRFHSEQIAEYALSFSGTNAIAAPYNSESTETRDGIFFRNFDDNAEISSRQQGNELVITYKGKDVLEVNTNISFGLLDNNFTLRYETDSDIPVITLLRNRQPVGDFVISGASILLLDAPVGSTEFFAVPDNQNGSGGFAVTTDDKITPLPSGGKFFETAEETFGVGFHLDDNFALQFASGVPLGEAATFGVGPNGILLGDPSVQLGIPLQKVIPEEEIIPPDLAEASPTTLPDENAAELPDGALPTEEPSPEPTWEPKLFAGFDRGVGKEIARYTDKKITTAVQYDYNGDDYPDILLPTGEGRGRVLQNMGDLGFRDIGEILADATGFASPSALDSDLDNFDEIIALNEQHEIKFFHNQTEVLDRNDDKFNLPTGEFIQLKTADFDADGFDDLLLQSAEGSVLVAWGSADGFSDTAQTELGEFGTQIEAGNLATNNTLISFPGITERTDKTIPLYVKAPISAADGLTTADNVLISEDMTEEATLTDPTFAALEQAQQQFPQSFAEDITDTRLAALSTIAFFAPLPAVAEKLGVELTMKDDNGGAVNLGDQVTFTLKLDNNTNRDLLFSLAHVLNPALVISEQSLKVPDSWPSARAKPRLQTLDQGQLRILGINLNKGESRTLTFTAEMTEQLDIKLLIRKDLSVADFAADGKPDVTVIIPGLNGQYHYLTQGARTFAEYFEYASATEAAEIFGEMTDTDGDGVPDKYLNDTNGDDTIDVADQVFNEFKTDTDEDGYPDSWDEMQGIWEDYQNEDWDNALEQFKDIGDEIMSYTACDGGCLNLPINFAFLVPGTFNLFETLAKKVGGIKEAMGGGGGGPSVPGVDLQVAPELQQFVSGAQQAVSGLFGPGGGAGGLMDKVSGFVDETATEVTDLLKRVQEGLGLPAGVIVGSPVFGTLRNFPFVCSGAPCYAMNSIFRMYVSPTLTGGVGVAFCIGEFPGSYCKAFAPAKLNLPICDEPKSNRGVVNQTDSDSCSFSNHQSSKAKVTKKDGGFRGLLQMLETQGSYSITYDTGINRRVMPFPWNWLYEQVAEFQAMFSLPSVTVYYPDMSGWSPKSFRDRFSDLYDDIDTRVGEVSDGLADIGSDVSEAVTTLPAKTTKIFVPEKTAATGVDRDWLAEAKTASKEIMGYKKDIETNLNTFNDLYSAISELPLIRLEPQVVHIKVPYLSRAQILAIMADLEEWVVDAQSELDRVRENWTSCPAGTPIETCSKQQALLDHVNGNTNKLIATARTNINTLKEYLNLPEIIGSIDMSIAQWLSQILCFLDTTVFSLMHWYVLNKQRLEAWIELYFFMEEIVSSWEIIKDFFLDYESFCHDCRVDRGGLVLSTFQIFMGVIPTPPIVRFPRLPNITLDLTQIKGGVTIPVPKPDIRFVPVIFPKVPRLSLPDSPSLGIDLPGIPLIPKISAVPPVPPFPEIPIIELPDLPPPPRIPDLPDFIGDFLELAKPFLYIYCLYKNGIFPHPEIDLKSVIEDLTMRPVLSMTNFDFSGALFEDFQIPSVRELSIELQMNLDMYAADYLVDAMRAAVLPWNTAATDLRLQGEIIKRDMYNTLQLMQYNIEEIPDQNIDLTQGTDAATKSSPLTPFFAKLTGALQDESKFYAVSDLRKKYGGTAVRLPDQFPIVDQINALRGDIARLQDNLLEEHKVLLATRDVTRLKGNFAADSKLASTIYEASIGGGLPEISTFKPQSADASSHAVSDFLTDLEARAAELVPVTQPSLAGANEVLNIPSAVSEQDLVGSGSDIVQQEGYFGQCSLDGEALSARVLYHQEFADSINTNLMIDLDLDGDEEMIFVTETGVYVKENHTIQNPAFHFTTAPEIGSFAAFVPVQEAVKNIRVISRADGAKVTFEPRYDGDLLGIEITAREQKSGYEHDNQADGGGAVLTALLVPTRFLVTDKTYDSFVPNDTFQIGPWQYSGTLFVQEFVNQQIELPLPIDRFWHIRIREIRTDGFSTGSEIFLAAPETAIDTQAPIILGNLQSEAVIYEDVDLSVPIFDDGSSINAHEYNADASDQTIESAGFDSPIDLFDNPLETGSAVLDPDDPQSYPNALSVKDFGFVPEAGVKIEWDINGDGMMDASGDSISFRPKRPGKHELTIRATDPSGNVSEEKVVIDVAVPRISLSSEELLSGKISGQIDPGYAGMPFAILRERDGRSEVLQTASADDDGKYRTERFGKFEIADFDFSPGVELRDEDGTVLASVDRGTGRVLFSTDQLSLSASSLGEVRVVEDVTGRILFSLQQITDGNTDVQIVSEPLDLGAPEKISQGVYLIDDNPNDALRAGSLPGNAPSFAGGAVIFADSQSVAVVSALGEIFLLDNTRYRLQIKKSEAATDPVILQLVDIEGDVNFDIFVSTAGERLFLTKAKSSDVDVPQISAIPSESLASEEIFSNNKPFADVPSSHPAFEAIEILRNKKIVQGFADGSFRPDAPLSRAEFVKMTLAAALCRECALDSPAENNEAPSIFTDVFGSAWYRFCVELANDLGIINGFADKTFKPDISITRAEAAAILLRTAKIPLTSGTLEQVSDLPLDAWYLAEMITAIDIGLVPVHFGKVYPDEAITRGEFAQMATKVLSTNACQAPGPVDQGVTQDLCPQVPENANAQNNTDGCPEFDFESAFVGKPAGTYITSSITTNTFPMLDFSADIIPNDRFSVAIMSEDNSEIYAQSAKYEIPLDFIAPQ